MVALNRMSFFKLLLFKKQTNKHADNITGPEIKISHQKHKHETERCGAFMGVIIISMTAIIVFLIFSLIMPRCQLAPPAAPVCGYLLIASTNRSKKLKGKSGSGSSRKNIFSAPVTTWMSSHWLSSKFSFSSGKTRGEMEQLVLMKQLQDTNYYVNVCLLSSATVNSLLHLEVWCCAFFFFFLLFFFFFP